jgi:hypothetical protein
MCDKNFINRNEDFYNISVELIVMTERVQKMEKEGKISRTERNEIAKNYVETIYLLKKIGYLS